MDIRKMKLSLSDKSVVKSDSVASYMLGEQKLGVLEANLTIMLGEDVWSPHYQAWRNLAYTYLTSGANSDLTTKYLNSLFAKRELLIPEPNECSLLVSEILKIRTTATQELFNGFEYKTLEQFANSYCSILINKQKTLKKQLYSMALYNDTLKSQLGLNTDTGLMCAVMLYRHCHAIDKQWDSFTLEELKQRLEDWTDLFLKEFDFVTQLVEEKSDVYTWYSGTVRSVLERTWRSALVLSNRIDYLSASDVYAVNVATAEELVRYVNQLPCVYDDPWDLITVWDALAGLLFTGNPADPLTCIKRFYPLCIHFSTIAKLIEVLNNFYWIIKDGNLSDILYIKKLGEHDAGIKTTISLEEYPNYLRLHGFPPLTESR